uniref:Gem-associated protein 8 n=1 Tax=Plectus sambesii TaxID=2011161 RepID=A0A914VYB6_9BILA
MSASEGDWHAAPQFAPYWQHYEAAKQWTNEHARVLQRIAADARRSHSSDILLPPPPMPPPPPPFKLNSNRKRKRFIPAECPPMAVELASASADMPEQYDNEEMDQPTEEVEMSDEMIAFFRKTMEHRLERDKSRAGLDTEDTQEGATEQQSSFKWLADMHEYVSADKVGVSGLAEASLLPPQLHKAEENRRAEAKRVYGEDAEKILAMETLMQMRFDQEYDKSKPPLWPNIPLNL